MTLVQPGVGMHVSVNTLDPSVAAKYAKRAAASGFALHIIPHSFFGAFTEGEVLPCPMTRRSEVEGPSIGVSI